MNNKAAASIQDVLFARPHYPSFMFAPFPLRDGRRVHDGVGAFDAIGADAARM